MKLFEFYPDHTEHETLRYLNADKIISLSVDEKSTEDKLEYWRVIAYVDDAEFILSYFSKKDDACEFVYDFATWLAKSESGIYGYNPNTDKYEERRR